MTVTAIPAAISTGREQGPRAKEVRAVPTLVLRRLSLSARNPRSLVLPVMNPVLFALVIAPALANTLATPGRQTEYMTFLALSTMGLLIPLNSLFSGIGVIVDRQQGAMRELLVAPIRRSSIVLGNLVAALAITVLQTLVLIGLSVARGANYVTSTYVFWFVGATLVFTVLMSALAEILATRLPSAEAYTGAIPVFAIVPYFFAGSLFPITSLPNWLEAIAKVLPLTHALALIRYGLTPSSGATALHNIWGLSSVTEMAVLSSAVIIAYALLAYVGAVRLFSKAGTS